MNSYTKLGVTVVVLAASGSFFLGSTYDWQLSALVYGGVAGALGGLLTIGGSALIVRLILARRSARAKSD